MKFKEFIRNRQQTTGILGLLLIVLSLTSLLGCPLPTPPAESKEAITGTLSYDAIETTVGATTTRTPSWSGHDTDQTVTYAITPAKEGIFIDQDTGVVTVAGTVPTTIPETYTVTATGTGDFQDTKTATITITINEPTTPMAGTFTYDELTVTVGKSEEISPSWSDNADKQLSSDNIGYAITPPAGKAGTGVTINTDNGKITVGPTATVEDSSGEYTVTATGTGDFQGTITAKITIAIAKKTITGEFTYTAIETTSGTTTTQTPSWSGHDTDQTVTYAITPAKEGISIDQDTGVVTVADAAPTTIPETYTVTATGTGDFQDTKTATITITINEPTTPMAGTFTYDELTVTVGESEEISPSWSGNADKQLSSGNIEYTITPPAGKAGRGVTINTDNGKITVGPTATDEDSSGEYTVTATGTGDFQGTITAKITIAIAKKTITGEFTYTAIETTSGTAKTQTPTWTGETSGQTVTYAITPAKEGISIDQDTGVVTVAGTAPTTSSGTYTVTATGTGDFQDTKTATITITINEPTTPMAGTFTYGELTVTVGESEEISPSWSGNADKQLSSDNIGYAITPPAGKAGTGVTINTDNGKITVGPTATVEDSSGEYTVTATGTGDFQGTITARITITIAQKTITGEFTYTAIETTSGTAKTQTPTWTGETSGQTVTYAITPAKEGISIDQDTGVVTVAGTAPTTSSGTYTVTATGTGDFQDTKTATITITINEPTTPMAGTFTYDELTVTVGESEEISPSWSGNADHQLSSGNIEYTITPPAGKAGRGVTINTDNGKITVGPTATVEDSSGEYTVTATGTGDFQGTITAKITIAIAKKTITGEFTYTAIETTSGTAKTQTPTWTGETSGQTVTYAITPAKDGISIDQDTGVVTVAGTVPTTIPETYTVTATGTGDFEGEVEGTITITIEPSSITGTFTYTGISTLKGTPKTSLVPTWTVAGQTVEYAITTRPNGVDAAHVTINAATGAVTVTKDALVASSGEYTVTATGIGDFQGTETATIEITIKEVAEDIEGSFSYTGLSAVVGKIEISPSPTWTGAETGQTVEYAITTRPNGVDAAHITVDTATGAVTVTDQALEASSGEYTVTATGTGAFQGTKTATIEITVVKAITGRFFYDDLTTAVGYTRGKTPQWSEHNRDQLKDRNIEYSLAPPDGNAGTGVGINGYYGDVVVSPFTPVASSGTYTVTAKGVGAFQGRITTTIKITINAEPIPITGTFSYDDFTIAAGNRGETAYPQWSEHNPGQRKYILYSIAPPDGNDGTGVTINWYYGAVLVSSSATAASSGTYTVTAKGTQDFGGTITGTIKVTITE